ncbi:MAG: DUF995 domain-containing protein [Rhizobiales bacterium]|nr:DUF995 domain-containing protein [Hyphomicrobiales bacterium]
MKIIYKNITQTLVVGLLASGLIACNTTASKTQTAVVKTAAKTVQKMKLSKKEIVALYAGKTLKGSGHSTHYKADGTWVNNSRKTGRWSVTADGILIMTGAVNLSLEIYRHGSRFYHRNIKSGSAGYYTIS